MSTQFDVLILAKDKRQLVKAGELYDTLVAKGRQPLIVNDYGFGSGDRKNYSLRSIHYYQDIFRFNYTQLKDDAYALFHSLAEKEIEPGVTLRQCITYQRVSLWDLSARYLFPGFMSFLFHLNLANAILDFERPQEFYVMDGQSDLTMIFRLLCRQKSINFIIVKKPEFILGKRLKDIYLALLRRCKRIKKLIECCYYTLLNLTRLKKLKKGYKILFFVPIERFFLSMASVITKYDAGERLVVNTFPDGSPLKVKESKISYVDMQGFGVSLFDRSARSVLKKAKDILCTNNEFTKSISYKGLSVGFLLKRILEEAVYERFPDVLRHIKAIRKILLIYAPKVVVISDNFFEPLLIAKSMSIPVVAMQTGHPDEFIYFGKYVADAVTVEGNYWKEYLSAKDVEAEKIWVTGSARFDSLYPGYSLTQDNRSELKKRIVFATIHADKSLDVIGYERLKQTMHIFRAIREVRNAHLIVKPHPFDTDLSIYEKIAKEVGLSDFSIAKNSDSLEVLSNCDLVISNHSRVTYEAVLMNKAVILLSSSSTFLTDDVWDFKRYGVVINVDNLDRLSQYISSALFDPEVSFRLKANRKEYIFEHAHKMDGKASDRIKEVIDQFVLVKESINS